MNILFTDDEIAIREIIVSKLDKNKLGIENIYQADNGIEALATYKQHFPEIVITDIKMPQMDGLELVEKIREISRDTKIIIISGYDEFEFAQKALRYKVDDYILKPAKINTIEEAILKAKNEVLRNIEMKSKVYEKNFLDLINGRNDSVLIDEHAVLFVISYKNKIDENWDFISEHSVIRYGIMNILREVLRDEKIVLAEDNLGGVVFLLFKGFLTRQTLVKFTDDIKKTVEESVGVFVDIGYSSDCLGRGFKECYTEAYRCIKEPQSAQERYSDVIFNAIKFIEENLNNTPSLEETAKFVHVTPNYFSAIFKKEVGKKFSKYIADRRIEIAMELLSTKKYKVYEVADMLGFENPRYFSLFFKKHTKMTISEFQKTQRG